MDTEDNFYTPRYHPDTARILRQAITSVVGLLVITLLTVGTVWFINLRTSTPVILGTQTP